MDNVMGGMPNELLEMLMQLMGQNQQPDTTITVLDEMQGAPIVDLTGNTEEEAIYDASGGGDMMAQFTKLFTQ
jgi:hypothetical protein